MGWAHFQINLMITDNNSQFPTISGCIFDDNNAGNNGSGLCIDLKEKNFNG